MVGGIAAQLLRFQTRQAVYPGRAIADPGAIPGPGHRVSLHRCKGIRAGRAARTAEQGRLQGVPELLGLRARLGARVAHLRVRVHRQPRAVDLWQRQLQNRRLPLRRALESSEGF